MKEIDFKNLQQLIQSELDVLNIKYVIVFFIINLLVVLVNWIVQKNIKNLENEIYRKKVREDKRITLIEDIYRELVTYTYILNSNEINSKIEDLTELERKIAYNKLYLDKKFNSSISDFIDYIKNLMTDFRKKDFKKENELLAEIEKHFNK